MIRVQVRGIYATALTDLLYGKCEVVNASDAIEERFEATFETGEPTVTIHTTDDRLGVGIVGDPEGVDSIRDRLEAVGIDALAWEDTTPRGAVFEADVIDTLGSGAVVDLGSREGFLPYSAVEGHVSEGDAVEVQVHEPAPPWGDRRPGVDTEIRVFGGIADLVRGEGEPTADVADAGRATELARTTEMLPTDVPDGWRVAWQYPAAAADVDDLDDALSVLADRADAVESALKGSDPPEATAWVGFGRESRFALDERRASVTATMAGHHRIKAGAESASTAVDFVEALCDPIESFPTEVVFEQFGPREGDDLAIEHGKPDGRRFSLGRGTVMDRDGETVTVKRELTGGGEYDALGTPKESGDVAVTKLTEGKWWYPTTYRNAEGESKGTYVNVCTPVEIFPEKATYVDLHVDVVKPPGGEPQRVDDDELDAAVERGNVPQDLAKKARDVASAVENALG